MSRLLKRLIWDLERFGLTPKRVWERRYGRTCSTLFVVSIPKAGTHLVERALCVVPGIRRARMRTLVDERIGGVAQLGRIVARCQSGEILLSHLAWQASTEQAIRRAGATIVFVIRDPRDIVVSEAHFVVRRRRHQAYVPFKRRESLKSRLRLAIGGSPSEGIPGIAPRLALLRGWLGQADLVLRFEALVGSLGRDVQIRELARLYAIAGVTEPRREAELRVHSVVSSASPTFRRGAVGGWKEAFDEELRDLYDRHVGPEARFLGYE